MKKVNVFENIEKIMFNKPATIIIFKDGGKSVAKCSKDDEYDPFVGYLVALVKYVLPKKYNLVKLLEDEHYQDFYFTGYYHNNVGYTVLNNLINDNTYIATGVVNPGYIYYNYNYNYETRKLICLLKCFANNYYKYEDYFIIHVYDMIKTSIRDKKQLNYIYGSKIFDDYVDNKLSDICKYIGNDVRFGFDFGADVIMDDHDSILKILPTMNVYGSYPESLIKGCGVQRRSGRVPFKKRIDYTKYNIDKSNDDSVNAMIFNEFLMDFNNTGSCSNEEYFRHATFGLMSELGELKALLTHIIYTAEYSVDNIAHINRELSDIYWMLCEYISYCDSSFDMSSFQTYINYSIFYHECINTKYSCDDCRQLTHILTVVDNMIMTVTKIMGMHQRNYEKISYTNDNSFETKKKIIGVYGDKGNIGETGPQGCKADNFVLGHDLLICDIFNNMLYIVKYILRSTPSFFFRVSMDKIKKRYPDGLMDPERSINRKPEDV